MTLAPRQTFAAHPWHGIAPGPDVPHRVTAFVEIVPTDGIKYELDKASGHLRVDRPQRYSSLCPSLYGFIPQTYCGTRVGQRCSERNTHRPMLGDGDPLDVCVLTERSIPTGGFLATVRPLGGLRMVDGDEADDKILAVLEGDLTYGHLQKLSDIPASIVERLEHYFLSYKQMPGETSRQVEIVERYDVLEAHEVIQRSLQDYLETFV